VKPAAAQELKDAISMTMIAAAIRRPAEWPGQTH
jgi:hypothetical protein